jgi:hypothetical protein
MVGDRYCGGNSKELGAGELTILSLAKVACSTRPEHVVLWCWRRQCADCSESCGLGLLSAVPVSASRLINQLPLQQHLVGSSPQIICQR